MQILNNLNTFSTLIIAVLKVKFPIKFDKRRCGGETDDSLICIIAVSMFFGKRCITIQTVYALFVNTKGIGYLKDAYPHGNAWGISNFELRDILKYLAFIYRGKLELGDRATLGLFRPLTNTADFLFFFFFFNTPIVITVND